MMWKKGINSGEDIPLLRKITVKLFLFGMHNPFHWEHVRLSDRGNLVRMGEPRKPIFPSPAYI